MKASLLASLAIATLSTAIAVSPAKARLQIALNSGSDTFTCFDGQLGCDQSGGANNLLLVNATVNGILIQIALTQSVHGGVNELQLSSSSIVNESGVPLVLKLLASDTDFVGPVKAINNSASLTFNQNIGAPNSTLSFWADAANTQGANPTNTPGVLLESVSGHAVTDPDSFAGSLITPFDALGDYSMTEGASIAIRGLGSVTGFNQSMESTAVPEPSTWAMVLVGFAGLGWGAWSRKRVRALSAL
jgi:hypothetical protein